MKNRFNINEEEKKRILKMHSIPNNAPVMELTEALLPMEKIVAGHEGKTWDELPEGMKELMTMIGFNKELWDNMDDPTKILDAIIKFVETSSDEEIHKLNQLALSLLGRDTDKKQPIPEPKVPLPEQATISGGGEIYLDPNLSMEENVKQIQRLMKEKLNYDLVKLLEDINAGRDGEMGAYEMEDRLAEIMDKLGRDVYFEPIQ